MEKNRDARGPVDKNRRKWRISRRVVLLEVVAGALLVGALAVAASNPQKLLLRQALASQVSYFEHKDSGEPQLTRLTPRVYTYNWYWDRTLVIDTAAGLVVVDPFTPHLTRGLKQALLAQGLDKPVDTLIYSHYHLDHVGGGEVLQPREVIAHQKCPGYWADFKPRDLLPPTRFIEGDTTLEIGGVRIELVHMGNSHSDTLYAIYLPSEKVLYAPDTVANRVFLPAGGAGVYSPGYFRSLDRLAALDFETFVASHFGYGTKADFLANVELMRDVWRWGQEAFEKFDGPKAAHLDRERLAAFFDYMYERLEKKYGGWHGFNEQAMSTIAQAYTAMLVGL